MTKESLMEILNEKSMAFSEKEIVEMINTELDKDPDEMDSDFIDLCLDVLDGKYGEGYYVNDKGEKIPASEKNAKPKGKNIKLGKTLLVAAVAAAVLACSITAGAKLVKINASDKLVQYNDNHFNITLNRSDVVDDIISTLANDGIENAVLPSAILTEDYVISDYQYTNKAKFDFSNSESNIFGNIVISTYDSKYDFYAGQGTANEDYFAVEEIDSNGIEILTFESADYTAIVYVENNYEYTITLCNCDFDTTVKIAETIGE